MNLSILSNCLRFERIGAAVAALCGELFSPALAHVAYARFFLSFLPLSLSLSPCVRVYLCVHFVNASFITIATIADMGDGNPLPLPPPPLAMNVFALCT